jgi:hypothetical protein
MKLHPRNVKVERAQNSICRAFFRELEKHDLTYLEAIGCAAEITQSQRGLGSLCSR